MGTYALPLGVFIVASSFALVTYARRSQSMLKRMEGNIEKRAAPKRKDGPKTKEEHDKTRKRMEDDEF
jgi:hypothetical protein